MSGGLPSASSAFPGTEEMHGELPALGLPEELMPFYCSLSLGFCNSEARRIVNVARGSTLPTSVDYTVFW